MKATRIIIFRTTFTIKIIFFKLSDPRGLACTRRGLECCYFEWSSGLGALRLYVFHSSANVQ